LDFSDQGNLLLQPELSLIYKDNGGAEVKKFLRGIPCSLLDFMIAAGKRAYPFASPITFSPGSYWFAIAIGPSDTTDPTEILGSGGDAYSGGYWSTSPGQDAYFRIQVASRDIVDVEPLEKAFGVMGLLLMPPKALSRILPPKR